MLSTNDHPDYYGIASAINLNNKHRIKLPRKRLYRTNSIARELRNIGKAFEWFTKNSITVPLPVKNSSERKRQLFITGSLTCYKVRIDVWSYVSGGDFTYREYESANGSSLLYSLVRDQILTDDFLPGIPPYQKALLNDL